MVSSKIMTFNGKNYEFRTDGRIFRQLKNGTWIETGKADNGRGYLRVRIAGKIYTVHRIIWTVFNGLIPDGFEIDHINRIRDDNRLENLRLVTFEQNQRNKANSILADELEAGMKYNSPDYKNAWVKKNGYQNYTDYHNALAQKQSYEDYNHYRRVMKARSKAKIANP